MLFALLTGLSLSMDAFAISVTNGMTMKGFRFRHAAIMALYFGAFQFLMPLIGSFLAGQVAAYAEAIAPFISFALLAFIGGRMLLEGIRAIRSGEGTDESGSASAFSGGRLDHKKLVALAVATSIDALAVGVAMGIDPDYCGGLGLLPASAVIGVVTFFVCLAGCYGGKLIPNLSGEKAETLGGAILVAIGIKLLIGGLI